MKTKLSILLTAIASGLISTMPAQASSMFGTEGIMFDEDTTIEFDFGESGGLFRSELGIYEVDDQGNVVNVYDVFNEVQAHDGGNGFDWAPGSNYPIGTCGTTVLDCTTQFTFEAGKQYTMGLFSYHRNTGSLKTISYSTSSLDSMKQGGEETNAQLFLFGSWGSPNDTDPFVPKWGDSKDYAEGYSILANMEDLIIGIDDTGNADDADYNDFKIIARKVPVDVPEPTVLLGLGVVAGGMFLTRSSKEQK